MVNCYFYKITNNKIYPIFIYFLNPRLNLIFRGYNFETKDRLDHHIGPGPSLAPMHCPNIVHVYSIRHRCNHLRKRLLNAYCKYVCYAQFNCTRCTFPPKHDKNKRVGAAPPSCTRRPCPADSKPPTLPPAHHLVTPHRPFQTNKEHQKKRKDERKKGIGRHDATTQANAATAGTSGPGRFGRGPENGSRKSFRKGSRSCSRSREGRGREKSTDHIAPLRHAA